MLVHSVLQAALSEFLGLHKPDLGEKGANCRNAVVLAPCLPSCSPYAVHVLSDSNVFDTIIVDCDHTKHRPGAQTYYGPPPRSRRSPTALYAMADAEKPSEQPLMGSDAAATDGKLPQSQRPGGKKRKVALYVAFVGAGYSVGQTPFLLQPVPASCKG